MGGVDGGFAKIVHENAYSLGKRFFTVPAVAGRDIISEVKTDFQKKKMWEGGRNGGLWVRGGPRL